MKKSCGAKTLIFPTPTWVVGTYNEDGKPNLATVAWGGICCSEPPCLAVSLRKATCTYGNIVRRKAFTVCVPSEKHVREADFCGIATGAVVDKFAAARLTPVASQLVDAPYVEEFPLSVECKLLHVFDLGRHTQFVGQVMDVKADEEVLDDKQVPDVEKVRPILFAPESWAYHGVGKYLGQAFSIGKQVQG